MLMSAEYPVSPLGSHGYLGLSFPHTFPGGKPFIGHYMVAMGGSIIRFLLR
jgi:hypothetical protein